MPRPRKDQIQFTNSFFKQLRLNTGLTQEQLAGDIGVSLSTIRRWEKGTVEPTFTVAQLKGFCSCVNLSLDELPNILAIKD